MHCDAFTAATLEALTGKRGVCSPGEGSFDTNAGDAGVSVMSTGDAGVSW
jgi:hypothetical protein